MVMVGMAVIVRMTVVAMIMPVVVSVGMIVRVGVMRVAVMAMIVVVREVGTCGGRLPVRPGADALHVMVVALLRQPDLCLKAQNLRAVLAHLAVHQVVALQNLLHAVDKGF